MIGFDCSSSQKVQIIEIIQTKNTCRFYYSGMKNINIVKRTPLAWFNWFTYSTLLFFWMRK